MKTVRNRIVAWAGGLAAAGSTGWFLLQPIRVLRHITDSWYLYSITAARILASGSHALYSSALQAKTLSAYLGTTVSATDIVPFERPPVEALMLVPLAGFDLHTSHLIFSVISLCFSALAAWLLFHNVLPQTYSRSFRAVIVGITLCTVPAAMGLWGDESPLFPALAVGALILAEKKRLFGAGLCLGAILLLRPQLVWLLPVLALGARQWRLFGGLCVGAAVLVLTTVLILGPSHVADWTNSMFQADVQGSQVYTFGLPGWIGYTLSSPTAAYVAFGVAVVGGVLAALFYGRRLAKRPDLLVAGGLAASLATALHIEPWNLILLAMPLCVLARSRPNLAILIAIGMDVVQILTFGQYGPPIEYWLALAPVAVAMGLWVSRDARQRHSLVEELA